MALMEIRDLRVVYRMPDLGLEVKALRGVDLDVERGEILGLVGESGSGKSTLAHAVMRILKPPARLVSGKVILDGVDILSLDQSVFDREYRWRRIAYVPQASQNALNPTMRVLDHFFDTGKAHGLGDRSEVERRARELVAMTGLDPERVLKLYPHQLSGGMKQRVLIALSLLLEPEVLILDEPTSALDVVTQAGILRAIKQVNKKLGVAIVFITHDVSLMPSLADRVAVMYAGKVVEVGPTDGVIYEPLHPYVSALISSIPSLYADVASVKPIRGEPPSMVEEIRGCPFWPRCPYVKEVCREREPALSSVDNRKVACFLWSPS
ncbi:oligopeptide/dipeptide ABC transporter, ATPase subunit [Thermoproteus uzoniensis 768-20]|uniref:Oligopeptide/dipeptide ABC transporter, ATPase subunit n=2 Tax=Thermoproteus TaxID=2270 RepID=F2L1H8_THEU7|nr:oligopeptide/dipeptide ABC transporter, ATPase subunit [Thermoproteus uzoniensis 768-20]